MPFSSDGETIDFIYGVINWKCIAAGQRADEQEATTIEMPRVEFATAETAEEEQPLELTEALAEEPLELTDAIAEEPLELTDAIVDEPLELTDAIVDEPLDLNEVVASAEPAVETTLPPVSILEIGGIADAADAPEVPTPDPAQERAAVHFAWEDGPLADVDEGELPNVELDDDAGLADRLWAARETADAVKAGEGRTRAALYRALSLAYDFALTARQNPQEYDELLEESGMKAQARAPMTPIVKLVFGIDYDKARLTEFAAALSYALRQKIALGAFQEFIEKQSGGLKALVAAERQARRPEPKADTKGEIARARLRSARPISLADVPAEEEFAVVVTRRGADGRHEPVAIVEDEAVVERAIRAA
jgi:hypothetical protein